MTKGVYSDRGSVSKAKSSYDVIDAVQHHTDPWHPRHHVPFAQPAKESELTRRKKSIFKKLSHLKEKSAAIPFRSVLLFFRFFCLLLAVPFFILFKELPLLIIRAIARLLKKTASLAERFFSWIGDGLEKGLSYIRFPKLFRFPSFRFPRWKLPKIALFERWSAYSLKRENARLAWKPRKEKKPLKPLSFPGKKLFRSLKRAVFFIGEALGSVGAFLIAPFRKVRWRKFGSYIRLPPISFTKVKLPKVNLPKLRLFAFTMPHLPTFSLSLKKVKKLTEKETLFPLALSVAKLGQNLKKGASRGKKTLFSTLKRSFRLLWRNLKKVFSGTLVVLLTVSMKSRPKKILKIFPSL